MLFDFRVFTGQSFDGKKQTADELLRSMDNLKIEKALACPLKPLSYDMRQANAGLAQDIKTHQDRLIGAARIDPWQPEAVDLLQRAHEEYGMRALFLNPWEENFRADHPILDPLMAMVEKYRIPVLLASGYPWVSEALQVCRLALRWPKVAVVMTNGGQINISGLGQADATLAMQKAPNLHIDTAGVYRQDFIEETLEALGGERVLFGSGAPYFDQRYETRRVLMVKTNDSARQAMQAGNALRLLNLF